MKKVLVCVVCLFLLAACGSPGSNHPSVPPGNFLYYGDSLKTAGATEAIFLSWVNTNGSLSGQTQDASIYHSSEGEQVKSIHGSFTGVLTNGQVSLNFGGFLGWSYTITGTYDGSTLTLNLPTQDGGVGSFAFIPATPADFNTAVSALQTAANNDNATAIAAQDQAIAAATTAAVTRGQQQAVTQANQAVAYDFSSLQDATSQLNQIATFDSVFSNYAQNWQQMKNDYQTEVNDSKNGCGDGSNYGTVQSDAGTVQSDEGSIQSDDGSFESQKASIDGDYENVQSLQATLTSDWQTLQQAIANNSSGVPSSDYSQNDINNAIATGNNALSNADAIMKKAKQKQASYDQKADNLNNQAQALPEKMGC